MSYPDHLRAQVEEYLEQLRFSSEPGTDGLEEAMRYSLLAGGKRIRPVLALATASALGRTQKSVLPLAAALWVKAKFSSAAARVKPGLDKTSTVSLVLVMVLLTAVNFRSALAVFGTGGILAGLLFLAFGYGVGWLLGGPAADTRRVLGLGTAQRNIAAALVVGGQSFDDPKVVVMVVVIAIVGLMILMPLSKALSRRA